MNIKLLGDRVLIEPKGETKTGNGLIVTRQQENGVQIGAVVAVGIGRTENGIKLPMRVSVGDNVMFEYGKTIHLEGKEYTLVNETDIIMIS
jgi:co-chaperonin GroES (HSP10)